MNITKIDDFEKFIKMKFPDSNFNKSQSKSGTPPTEFIRFKFKNQNGIKFTSDEKSVISKLNIKISLVIPARAPEKSPAFLYPWEDLKEENPRTLPWGFLIYVSFRKARKCPALSGDEYETRSKIERKIRNSYESAVKELAEKINLFVKE